MGVRARSVAALIASGLFGVACGSSLTPPDGGGGTGAAGSGTAGTGLGGAGGRGGSGSVVGPSPECAQISRPAEYTLVRRRNLASPVPDPTGVAFDGEALWIMGGRYAPPSNVTTLVRFDPDRLTVDRTFSFDNLMETLGTGVFGITWDGSAIWISVSGNRNKLVRVDPTTGEITRTMSSPAVLGPSDLDFDGGILWLSSGSGNIFALDPVSGGIIRTLPIPDGFSGRDSGVAARFCELWVGALFGGMGVEDPFTGASLASVVRDDGTPFIQDEAGALMFLDDQLVHVNSRGITYYDIR